MATSFYEDYNKKRNAVPTVGNNKWLEAQKKTQTAAPQPTAEVVQEQVNVTYPGNVKTEPATSGVYTGRNNAISDVIKYKRWYDDAKASGDTAAMDNAHKLASGAYNWLNNNGFGSDAKELEGMNYAAAKKWATDGMTQTRPYFYDVGKAYGLKKEDIDNLITYDNPSRNIYFGGTNLGSADITIDGVSYWDSPEKLDNAFNSYLERTNTNLSDEDMANKYKSNIYKRMNENWDLALDNDNKYFSEYDKMNNSLYEGLNKNVVDSKDYQEVFKQMMEPWNLASFEGRDAAAAEGMARNGGNVDSFSAADARQRQASLLSQGQQLAHQAALDTFNANQSAWNDRMGYIKSGLSDLGIYLNDTKNNRNNMINQAQNEAQRLFENDQTAKNNAVENARIKAEVMGVNPIEWEYDNDPVLRRFYNADGTLKKDVVDATNFQQLIDKAKKDGNTELAEKLAAIRTDKMLSYFDEYGQYMNEGDLGIFKAKPTSNHYLDELGIKSAENIAMTELEHQARENELNRQHEKDLVEKDNQMQREKWAHDDKVSKNSSYPSTSGNATIKSDGTYVNGVKVGDKNGKPILTDSQAKEKFEEGNRSEQVLYAVDYYGGSTKVNQDDIDKAWEAVRKSGAIDVSTDGLFLSESWLAKNPNVSQLSEAAKTKAISAVSDLGYGVDYTIEILTEMGFKPEDIEIAMSNPYKK